MVMMIKNEKINEDIWCRISRKVISFKEIKTVETLKTAWGKTTC